MRIGALAAFWAVFILIPGPGWAADPDVLLHLECEETAGNTANDSSNYSQNGLISGDMAVNAPGALSRGFAFNGTDGVITVNPDNFNSEISNALTVSAWVKRLNSAVPVQGVLSAKWGYNSSYADFSAFDVSNIGGLATVGYGGGCFDGRYVYFAPYRDSLDCHSRMLRFDTHADYKNTGSWEVYDTGNIDGLITRGFVEAIYVNGYVYFVPSSNGITYNGIVARYNTGQSFSDPGSWEAFNAGATDGLTAEGFSDAVFDGRYLYFVPANNNVFNHHGVVLRYDTQRSFKVAASWQAYDAADTSGLICGGYLGGTFDGRYIYFAPHHSIRGTLGFHGHVLRYDTSGEFRQSSSWMAYDAGTTDGLDTAGFSGAVYDGRYVYFAPGMNHDRDPSGVVLRLDPQGDFTDASSWAAYDAGNTGGIITKNYNGLVFDGRYIHFVPGHYLNNNYHGRALRYDTSLGFNNPAAWQSHDAGNTDSLTATGYEGAVFDGRFIYYVPNVQDVVSYHGKSLRYDTCGQEAMFNLRCDPGRMAVNFTANTSTRAYSVTAPLGEADDFAYIAGTYDGSRMRIFIDGILTVSETVPGGPVCQPGGIATVGGLPGVASSLAGIMDEIKVFRKALSPAEVDVEYLAIMDTDGDGMRDDWESQYFGDLSHDGTLDTEGDSLSDLLEYQNGTDPHDPDTDGDHLSDGSEVLTHLTDPLKKDTDADTMNDAWELVYDNGGGWDPLINDMANGTYAPSEDPDADGLSNHIESTYNTDPLSGDTDGDGLPDAWECRHGLNPLVDDAGRDPDGDGFTNLEELANGTDPHGSSKSFMSGGCGQSSVPWIWAHLAVLILFYKRKYR